MGKGRGLFGSLCLFLEDRGDGADQLFGHTERALLVGVPAVTAERRGNVDLRGLANEDVGILAAKLVDHVLRGTPEVLVVVAVQPDDRHVLAVYLAQLENECASLLLINDHIRAARRVVDTKLDDHNVGNAGEFVGRHATVIGVSADVVKHVNVVLGIAALDHAKSAHANDAAVGVQPFSGEPAKGAGSVRGFGRGSLARLEEDVGAVEDTVTVELNEELRLLGDREEFAHDGSLDQIHRIHGKLPLLDQHDLMLAPLQAGGDGQGGGSCLGAVTRGLANAVHVDGKVAGRSVVRQLDRNVALAEGVEADARAGQVAGEHAVASLVGASDGAEDVLHVRRDRHSLGAQRAVEIGIMVQHAAQVIFKDGLLRLAVEGVCRAFFFHVYVTFLSVVGGYGVGESPLLGGRDLGELLIGHFLGRLHGSVARGIDAVLFDAVHDVFNVGGCREGNVVVLGLEVDERGGKGHVTRLFVGLQTVTGGLIRKDPSRRGERLGGKVDADKVLGLADQHAEGILGDRACGLACVELGDKLCRGCCGEADAVGILAQTDGGLGRDLRGEGDAHVARRRAYAERAGKSTEEHDQREDKGQFFHGGSPYNNMVGKERYLSQSIAQRPP